MSDIFQICWVVDDIGRAEQEYADRFGVTKWLHLSDVRFGPQTCIYRGAPADFVIHVAIGYSGDLQVELIQPVTGDSIYRDYVAAHGPGIHHVAYLTDNLDAAVAEAAARGIEVAQSGSFGEVGMRFAYLATGTLGSYTEIMELSDQMRAMFDRLVPEGHRNPWQR